MDLKELLGEQLFDQVSDKLGEHKIDIVSDGKWIPVEKFNTVNQEKNEYKTQVDDLNKDLGKLQGQLKNNEDATKTIQDLQQKIKDKDAEMTKINKLSTIKLEALKAEPNDIEDILPHLDTEKVIVNDDGITGLKEQLESLKEAKPYLFKETTPPGTGGSKGGGPKGKTEVTNQSTEEFMKAIYDNQAKRN